MIFSQTYFLWFSAFFLLLGAAMLFVGQPGVVMTCLVGWTVCAVGQAACERLDRLIEMGERDD